MLRVLINSWAFHAPTIQAKTAKAKSSLNARTMSAYADSRGLVRNMPERIDFAKTGILLVVRILSVSFQFQILILVWGWDNHRNTLCPQFCVLAG